ncbi:MAG: hypothetical protein JW910_20425 [Anaerolineae bacterium]|nr:hypothetical protein [Anaerolineae bacterium]
MARLPRGARPTSFLLGRLWQGDRCGPGVPASATRLYSQQRRIRKGDRAAGRAGAAARRAGGWV